VKLSLVIPAYNEEKYLPRTMDALSAALVEGGEVIVVDNESTDTTRSIAESHGARIVNEHVRNIGKVRNTGAENATGEVVVFLDADTIVAPGVFEKIVEAMADQNCVGGSVAVQYEAPFRRPWMRFFMKVWTVLGRMTKMRQGALQFCRREAFEELNGYDETIYVGEDIDFHWRLDKLAGRRDGHTAFIESPAVTTSSRRWEKMGLLPMLFYTHPVTIFLAWRIKSVWKHWYENAIR
jgi:glycosyltransferase involved in cell wall biosynthesis